MSSSRVYECCVLYCAAAEPESGGGLIFIFDDATGM